MGFGERLRTALDERGQVCVGIDPHAHLLAAWGLEDSAAGARELALRVIDAAADGAGVVKPQVAFFERHAAAGFAVLEEVLRTAREAGLLVIADVKRGEIGTSMEGYADAWLRPGSPLEADAMTLNPYLGTGSLAATLGRAEDAGKGAFVLAATSNPEAAGLQRAVAAGESVAASVVREIAARNAGAALGATRLGAAGVVIGATVAMPDSGIDPAALAATPILAPGFGAQGARGADLVRLFGRVSQNVLVSASRSLVEGGASEVRSRIAALDREIRSAS
ncbi:orotidine-5'-phosphate decarboxylase [Homoserinibacter sp. YIM 151385]|uniref:orotidine-5'-phosphate decarboxylase n=1 Tax=Homoserinibacter sp. YIM 151385 TaxID=2985506 RepID=UPI0022F0CBD7|nr:orotidine-5'-phosphate decarboxylase [Homoserinibacter sp. YIM 151385]WBU39339.1 orotidine-5'-phosphate decarboxylase [Homoserinibacter sp. YIM 151385]